MKLILSLSLRNLLRQKRRNAFLGIAIGFGMMILVMANAFSYGISDTLFNRLIVYMAGHMNLTAMEESNKQKRVIRDKDRFIGLIKANVEGIDKVWEAIGVFSRVIGNAKGDNAIIVNTEIDQEFYDYFGQNIVEGNIRDFTGDRLENPVLVYSSKAKSLGVKCGDVIKARMQTISGQQQSARLTVAAIIRSSNMFEEMVMFLKQKDIKALLGYRDHETGALYVSFKKLNNPAIAIKAADKLHAALQPGVAVIYGEMVFKKKTAPATALGYSRNREAVSVMDKHVPILSGALPEEKSEKGVVVSKSLASSLGLKKGDPVRYRYKNKFGGIVTENNYTVTGVFGSGAMPAKNIVLMNEKTFYKTYRENLPGDPKDIRDAYIPDGKSALAKVFAPEWRLLPRTATHEDMQKKLSKMTKTKWKGPWLDINTMYETADQILQLEGALNMVAVVAGLILFFIILIGVLNTLRMTIRERTREIGTVRAIGMQRADVKYLFITEIVLLTAFACLAGIIMAFIMMWVLGLFTINTDSVLSILLVNQRLYFYPTAFSIIRSFAVIIILAGLTAYFPARRASNLSAVEALGHFE
ncbi:MAG TPA: FtsX-like permease family protein [Spirochaetota bacterium]|nr:FtsX-like permease family protein [Spirochaetota bacterium]HQF07424.1 FtsX-like permease family protein [Spirochaetota bacterium]HQH96684.1 FtsX-like permease family protein [Spirochaetota bacterium]HQJ69884.1 FtsX-like permease family protein [Spirochaetota bacterium]HRS76341.1 FtsX-like permease family protein [Spirochaetota bacterium]